MQRFFFNWIFFKTIAPQANLFLKAFFFNEGPLFGKKTHYLVMFLVVLGKAIAPATLNSASSMQLRTAPIVNHGFKKKSHIFSIRTPHIWEWIRFEMLILKSTLTLYFNKDLWLLTHGALRGLLDPHIFHQNMCETFIRLLTDYQTVLKFNDLLL